MGRSRIRTTRQPEVGRVPDSPKAVQDTWREDSHSLREAVLLVEAAVSLILEVFTLKDGLPNRPVMVRAATECIRTRLALRDSAPWANCFSGPDWHPTPAGTAAITHASTHVQPGRGSRDAQAAPPWRHGVTTPVRLCARGMPTGADPTQQKQDSASVGGTLATTAAFLPIPVCAGARIAEPNGRPHGSAGGIQNSRNLDLC